MRYKGKNVWCADYTEELTGNLGFIFIAGDPEKGVNIQPGWISTDDKKGGAAYDAERDGVLTPSYSQHHAGLFWNWAMRAGWQKWGRPTYRYGTINHVYTDEDKCDLTLDACFATDSPDGKQLSVNPDDLVIDGVDIDYMDCNAKAFRDGDRVLVKFDGPLSLSNPWGNATVIGFKEEPKKCIDDAYYYVFVIGQTRDHVQFLIWDAILNQEADFTDFPTSGNVSQIGPSSSWNNLLRDYFRDTLELEQLPWADIPQFGLYTVIDEKRNSALPLATWFTDDNGNTWDGIPDVTRFGVCATAPYDDQNDREYSISLNSAYKVYNAPFLPDESDQDIMNGHHELTCDGNIRRRTDWESYHFVAYGNSFQSGWNTFTGYDSRTRFKYGIFGYAYLLVPNSGPNQEMKCSCRSSHEESFEGYEIYHPGVFPYVRPDRYTKRSTTWKFISPIGEMADWEMNYDEFDANESLNGQGKSVGNGTAMMFEGKNIRIDASYSPTGGDTYGIRIARNAELSSELLGMLQVYAINHVKRTCTWTNLVGPVFTYEPIIHVWAGSDNIEIESDDCPDPTQQSKHAVLSAKLKELFIASNAGSTDGSTPSETMSVMDFTVPQPNGLLDLINNHRTAIGAQVVKFLPSVLSREAQIHCENIESGSVPCGHSGWSERVAKINACYGTYIALGEVVGCLYATDEDFFQGLLDSPQHKAIIENPDFTTVGIGHSGQTRTLIFKYVDESYI